MPVHTCYRWDSLLVGYAQTGIKLGGTITTPLFVNIGSSEAVDLQSIIPTGDDTSDNVFIQTLDAYGRTVDSYGWINWAGESGNQEAWCDDNYTILTGVSFQAGQGLWVTSNSEEDQTVQTAGKVGTNDVTVALRLGGTLTGNPFPTSVNIQDILPQGDDTSDNVFIQTLDAYGRTVNSYGWINWAGENGNQEAWVDDNYNVLDVTFTPGQGLWITTNSEEPQTIRFPAPEL